MLSPSYALAYGQAIAEALKTNASVREINLTSNGMGPEGAKACAGHLCTISGAETYLGYASNHQI